MHVYWAVKTMVGISLAASLLGCENAPRLSSDLPTMEAEACVVEIDGDWQKTADGILDSRYTREFNEEGMVIRQNEDRDGDGIINHFKRYVYNHEGLRVQEKSFRIRHDKPDDRTTFDYDQEGKMIRKQSSFDFNGNAKVSEINIYGEHGLLERIGVTLDGTTQTRHRYDVTGHKVEILFIENGDFVYRLLFSYNDVGQRVSAVMEYAEESQKNYRSRYQYNDQGQVSESTYDEGSDGVLNARNVFVYNDTGQLLSQSSDCDLDGISDWQDIFQYDSAGRLVESSVSSGLHDQIVIITSFDYSCYEH